MSRQPQTLKPQPAQHAHVSRKSVRILRQAPGRVGCGQPGCKQAGRVAKWVWNLGCVSVPGRKAKYTVGQVVLDGQAGLFQTCFYGGEEG